MDNVVHVFFVFVFFFANFYGDWTLKLNTIKIKFLSNYYLMFIFGIQSLMITALAPLASKCFTKLFAV